MIHVQIYIAMFVCISWCILNRVSCWLFISCDFFWSVAVAIHVFVWNTHTNKISAIGCGFVVVDMLDACWCLYSRCSCSCCCVCVLWTSFAIYFASMNRLQIYNHITVIMKPKNSYESNKLMQNKAANTPRIETLKSTKIAMKQRREVESTRQAKATTTTTAVHVEMNKTNT